MSGKKPSAPKHNTAGHNSAEIADGNFETCDDNADMGIIHPDTSAAHEQPRTFDKQSRTFDNDSGELVVPADFIEESATDSVNNSAAASVNNRSSDTRRFATSGQPLPHTPHGEMDSRGGELAAHFADKREFFRGVTCTEHAQPTDDGTPVEKQLVGLFYDGKNAPTVVERRFNDIAEQIIELAKAQHILVHEDQALLSALASLNVGDSIPKELYIVIAELIALSYVLQGKTPAHWHNLHHRVDQQA